MTLITSTSSFFFKSNISEGWSAWPHGKQGRRQDCAGWVMSSGLSQGTTCSPPPVSGRGQKPGNGSGGAE